MTSSANPTLWYSGRQYGSYTAIAFAIWLTGVIIVRLLPSGAFDGAWPILLYIASIGLGIATQLAAPYLVRLPFTETLLPVMVICGAALMMDGIAIGFTDIYSNDIETKVVVGGWLLWTFGLQVIISLFMIRRANHPI